MIHWGDISFSENWVKRLGSWRGSKILVRGNHDKLSQDFYLSCGFTAIVEELTLDLNNWIRTPSENFCRSDSFET